jgi:hypothetical protein
MHAWLLLAALQTQVATGPHSVNGIVVDSVRGRPLARAEVVIAGTSRHATTDSLGQFRFDSLAAGTYRLAFFHPLLDSMSLAVAPRVLDLPLAEGKAVLLAIPSAATIVSSICMTDPRTSSSLLMGRVLDPETAGPVEGAAVFVTWTDFAVSRTGIKRTPQIVQGGTDGDGVYRVCGLPAEVDAVVYAIREGSQTSRVPVASTRRDIVIRNLALEDPSTARGRASIAGTVKTAKGTPVAGASIGVHGTTRTATSDSAGTFSLSGLPLGTRNVVVRRLGFVPASIAVDLTSDVVHRVDARLEEYVLVMDPMYVIAQRDRALARLGFTERRKRGLGDFRTRADFERSNPVLLSDIVGTMRGVRVDHVNGQRVLRATGAGSECVHLVIDGVHWNAESVADLDDSVLPQHVAAVEVYGGASVPTEFEHGWARGCLTIVVWTRTRVKDFTR